MSSATNALNAAIFGTLSASYDLVNYLGGTFIYLAGNTPDGAALPYVEFDWPTDTDRNITAAELKDAVVSVRGYADTSQSAGSIDYYIDQALNKKTLSVSGFSNIWTRRENAPRGHSVDPSGKKYYWAGAQYRITITK